jgi:hypothetical protein
VRLAGATGSEPLLAREVPCLEYERQLHSETYAATPKSPTIARGKLQTLNRTVNDNT